MATAAEIMKELEAKAQNPANKDATPREARKRVSMSLPQLRLSVPDIPGYHLHWMKGTPERIAQAQAAGYEFVDADEVSPANTQLGGDAAKSGSTDLGSRVSLLASVSGDGEVNSDGQPLRLYLMKLKMEHWLEDQAAGDQRSAQTIRALTRGGIGAGERGESEVDTQQRYLDTKRVQLPEMFKPKSRRA